MDRLSALFRQYELYGSGLGQIADIGSDHGYLVERILASGFDGRAIATDISANSLKAARRTLGNHPQVEYRVCDGLKSDFTGTEMFFIAGMGGELIADILSNGFSSFINAGAIFVLQPMTKWESALAVICKNYVYSYFANEKDRHYRIMVAAPENRIEEMREGCLMLGSGDSSKDPDSSSMSKSLCRGSSFTEFVMRENIEDAILFFEHRRGVCLEIAAQASKSAESSASERAIKDARAAAGILDLLNKNRG